jgi:elongation factor P
MADTSDFRNGLIIRFKNDLYTIVEFQHVKPGKGGAFVRTKVKNMRTGQVLDNTFRAGEKVDVVRVERKKYQYLYPDGEFLMCMDTETYDQIPVSAEVFGDQRQFLKESDEVELLMSGSEIVNAEIAPHVNLEVTETEPGLRGDTATNVTKPATLETGAVVSVPLFVDKGDVIRVDTRTGDYIERVKK